MRIALALTLAAAPALAQDPPFGSQEDVADAAAVWEAMEALRLAGPGAIGAFPYEGIEPHGFVLETLQVVTEIGSHEGWLFVKRNYGPEGVSVEEMQADPEGHLAAVTVMFKREAGYDPENADWFYAKYLPGGEVEPNPAGVPLAGRVGKGMEEGCIPCHAGAGDFLFTTDAVE